MNYEEALPIVKDIMKHTSIGEQNRLLQCFSSNFRVSVEEVVLKKRIPKGPLKRRVLKKVRVATK